MVGNIGSTYLNIHHFSFWFDGEPYGWGCLGGEVINMSTTAKITDYYNITLGEWGPYIEKEPNHRSEDLLHFGSENLCGSPQLADMILWTDHYKIFNTHPKNVLWSYIAPYPLTSRKDTSFSQSIWIQDPDERTCYGPKTKIGWAECKIDFHILSSPVIIWDVYNVRGGLAEPTLTPTPTPVPTPSI